MARRSSAPTFSGICSRRFATSSVVVPAATSAPFPAPRDAALDDMIEAAKEMGANGIVGLDFDYEVLGESNGMLMVAVSGTAVRMA
jgi:hypothetical protein